MSFPDAVLSFLKENCIFRKKQRKVFCVLAGKMEAKLKLSDTKMIRKKALSAVKISSNLEILSVMAGDFWWTHPYIFIFFEKKFQADLV